MIAATEALLRLPEGNRRWIVERIRPFVDPLVATDLTSEPNALLEQAIRVNSRASVNHLQHGSEIIEKLVDRNELAIVGAEYSLKSGEVEFFEPLPGAYSRLTENTSAPSMMARSWSFLTVTPRSS
jgi:carbonic anhydrase